MPIPAPNDDATWQRWRSAWQLRDDTTYLNHGSFGPPPDVVRATRRAWLDRLDEQPMDFFVRQYAPALEENRIRLANFVGAASDDIVLVDNATFAMNIVAGSLHLEPGDEIILTDHEYGAVFRIWERACQRARTGKPRVATLPMPCGHADQFVDAVISKVTARTRLIVVSHITSATATILPVQAICDAAHQHGIPVCIDGPHAPVQVPLNIRALGCAFYTASCHKWLCAPFGTGFLLVDKLQQESIEPPVLSWGTLPPALPEKWSDEYSWSGTRDPTTLLTIGRAIEFMEGVGLEAFRERTHALARYARDEIARITKLPPINSEHDDWFGSMVIAELPVDDAITLQRALWEEFQIEVPIIDFANRRFIRVSCHLYNSTSDIDRLVGALQSLIHGKNR